MGELPDRGSLERQQLGGALGQPVQGAGQFLGLVGAPDLGAGGQVALAQPVRGAGHAAQRLADPASHAQRDHERGGQQHGPQADDQDPGLADAAAQLLLRHDRAHHCGAVGTDDREQHLAAVAVDDRERLAVARPVDVVVPAHLRTRAQLAAVGGQHLGDRAVVVVEVGHQRGQAVGVVDAGHEERDVACLLVGGRPSPGPRPGC